MNTGDTLAFPILAFYRTPRTEFNPNPALGRLMRTADLHHGIRQALDKKKPLRTATKSRGWVDPKDERYFYVDDLKDWPHHDVKAETDLTHRNDYLEETTISPLVLMTRGVKTRKYKRSLCFPAIEINSSFDSIFMIDTIPCDHIDDAADIAKTLANQNIEEYIEQEQEEDRRWRREQATEDAKILIKEIKIQKPEGECRSIIYKALHEMMSLRSELCL